MTRAAMAALMDGNALAAMEISMVRAVALRSTCWRMRLCGTE
ncbi:hypothetical protein [Mesorhizobium sp. M0317]